MYYGWVTGTARSEHRGRTTHVWQIELRDEAENMRCISRITIAIVAPAAQEARLRCWAASS